MHVRVSSTTITVPATNEITLHFPLHWPLISLACLAWVFALINALMLVRPIYQEWPSQTIREVPYCGNSVSREVASKYLIQAQASTGLRILVFPWISSTNRCTCTWCELYMEDTARLKSGWGMMECPLIPVERHAYGFHCAWDCFIFYPWIHILLDMSVSFCHRIDNLHNSLFVVRETK